MSSPKGYQGGFNGRPSHYSDSAADIAASRRGAADRARQDFRQAMERTQASKPYTPPSYFQPTVGRVTPAPGLPLPSGGTAASSGTVTPSRGGNGLPIVVFAMVTFVVWPWLAQVGVTGFIGGLLALTSINPQYLPALTLLTQGIVLLLLVFGLIRNHPVIGFLGAISLVVMHFWH